MHKTNHPPIKHIWFDLAGTLYRENSDLKAVIREHAYNVYRSHTGISGKEEVQQKFDDLYNTHGSYSASFRSLGNPDDFWQKEVSDFHWEDYFAGDEEVVQTLKELSRKVPISLFTNFKRPQIDELFRYLSIPQEYFTFILSGDDVAARKPSPDGFHLMIQKSKLPANQLLYVGDREFVDIIPAHAVGMQTCLVYGKGVKTSADYSFDIFKKLLTLV